MPSSVVRSFTRREVLRIGALTTFGSLVLPSIHGLSGLAHAAVCNPNRPGTPEAALTALKAGNGRWALEDQEHPGEDTTRRDCVANNAQTPFAAIISCSDSRVPPELIFDQGLGDLFVARVAGNVATGKLFESLLYGTGTLGAPLIFVLGHSSCGAVDSAVKSYPKHDLEFVNLIFPAVKSARRIVKRNGGDPDDPKLVIPVATDQNVIFTARSLRQRFQQQIRAGKLKVAGGRYDLDTQTVTILVGDNP